MNLLLILQQLNKIDIYFFFIIFQKLSLTIVLFLWVAKRWTQNWVKLRSFLFLFFSFSESRSHFYSLKTIFVVISKLIISEILITLNKNLFNFIRTYKTVLAKHILTSSIFLEFFNAILKILIWSSNSILCNHSGRHSERSEAEGRAERGIGLVKKKNEQKKKEPRLRRLRPILYPVKHFTFFF